MPQPRFQVSTSDAFGAPGLYIQQRPVSAPLRGIFRGTTGIAGECVRGPTGRVVYCPNYNRFLDVFGARDYGINGGTLRGKIWWAYQAKQFAKVFALRVAASDAVAASFTLETAAGGAGTAVLTITAFGVGLHGNDIMWKVLAASNGVANAFNLSIKLYDRTWLFENIDISSTNDNTAVVIGSDDATPIRLTKVAGGRPVNSAASTDGADVNGYTKLGQTVASFTSVAGSDGTIADADFTGTGKGIEVLNNAKGIDTKFVAYRSNTAVKTKIFGIAPKANLSLWLIEPDSETTTDTTFETEVASLRHRAIVPCFNHPYHVDPVTTVETVGSPAAQMASILSQIEYDVHPGVAETAELNQQVTRLYSDLSDDQRDALDLAGISYLNRDMDASGNNVILFGNGRTSDLTINNSQVNGERMKMYLIMLFAQISSGDQNRPNTKTARSKRKGAIDAKLRQLADSERFVDKDQDTGEPSFEIKNDTQVNTQTDRASGIQRDLIRVTLIPDNLYMQLQIEAGRDVVISEAPTP